MSNLSFKWNEPSSLAAELGKPLKQVSLKFAGQQRPMVVTLWRLDGSGFELYSEMHDVDERKEVGVLQFKHVFASKSDETLATVSPAFEGKITVSKLLIRESGLEVESGVVLTTQTGDEIVLVAGAYPYSLAVRGVLSLPHVFEPEYPLDQYCRVPFA